MATIDEQILRAAKEIVVKFIEVGRVSPSGFRETFKNVYTSVKTAVKEPEDLSPVKDEETK